MKRREPPLGVIFVILVMVTGASAIGTAHYLRLINDFRERNFQHFVAVGTAQALVADATAENRRARLVAALSEARAQAQACLVALSPKERLLLTLTQVDAVLALCDADLQTADRALSHLARGDAAGPRDAAAAPDEDGRAGPRGGPQAAQEGQAPADGPDRAGAKTPEFDEALLLSLTGALERDSLEFKQRVDRMETVLATSLSRIAAVSSSALLVLAIVFALRLRRSLNTTRERERDARMIGRRFDLALQASSDGFAIYDPFLRLVGCNDVYRRVWTDDPAELKVGMHAAAVMRLGIENGRFGETDEETAHRIVVDALGRLASAADDQSHRILSGDRHVEFRKRVTELGDRVVVMRDVTGFVRRERDQRQHAAALERAKAEIEHNALHDPLTGLPNRRLLDDRLAALLEQGSVALIRIDLDRFKQVNDVLGHAAGDHVLKAVADRLRACLREGDMAARVGGDEFVILLRSGATLAEAKAVAADALDRVTAPLSWAGKPCRFGASFGVALGRRDAEDGGEVLSHADAALYRAKRRGRGTIEVFSTELHARIIEERRLGDEFATALESGEILPYFQTKHAARDGAIVGVEVLARWKHPRRGLLAPRDFLPVIRTLGYEARLDEAIFEGAQLSLSRLASRGRSLPQLSFNVSAGRLRDPDFLAATKRLMQAAPFAVAFELLESISTEDMDGSFLMALDALKDAGAQIEIDDFGSDHASMATLTKVAPHGVKIDRSLVVGLGPENPRASRMVKAIVDMGRALELRVTAEGVETAAQRRCLADLGCDVLQGYFFSRPEPADALCRRLAMTEGQGAAS